LVLQHTEQHSCRKGCIHSRSKLLGEKRRYLLPWVSSTTVELFICNIDQLENWEENRNLFWCCWISLIRKLKCYVWDSVQSCILGSDMSFRYMQRYTFIQNQALRLFVCKAQANALNRHFVKALCTQNAF